ncbi:MAG TPA: class I SAM-dependent methyltransferase [Pyrinomonadaceae bacterium]|jgi:SAM-dependent methyltransferase
MNWSDVGLLPAGREPRSLTERRTPTERLPLTAQLSASEGFSLAEYFPAPELLPATTHARPGANPLTTLLRAAQRRHRRQRRRQTVGRAYDMALEVARVVPPRARVLDVGCGSGFIAHHLSALLGVRVVGLDVAAGAAAPIEYLRYDGARFPVPDRSFDAVLLCYVLHHAQDLAAVLNEVRRVVRAGGLVLVYEDIPQAQWDRFVCWTHDLRWRGRTGPCAFRGAGEWRALFGAHGFDVLAERPLSRWRNIAHPVCRQFYVLQARAGG